MCSERKYKVTGLDVPLANKLISEFDSSMEVESVEFMPRGKSTSNYKLHFKGTKEILLIRIMPVKDKTCFKELVIYQYLKDLIPIPEVYLVNDTCNIIDKPYQIVEFIEGVRLSESIEQTHEFNSTLIAEIAEKLALIHRTIYDREGFLSPDMELNSLLPPILTWYDHFLDLKAGERLGKELKDAVSKHVKNNAELLKEMTQQFVLSHGDFRPNNIMVLNDKITGIMDWEGALSAPVYFDLGQFYRNDEFFPRKTERIFLESYNNVSLFPLKDNWKEKARLMDLVNLLCLLDLPEENPIWNRYLIDKIKASIK